jgi:membrane carboxypeptidase/penicillin-binding protein
MKVILKYIVVLFLVITGILFTYYTYEVLAAKNYTNNVIIKDMHESQWRSLNGFARKLDIDIQDLSKRQIDILLKVQDPGFYKHNGIDLSTPGAGLTTLTQAIVKKLYFKEFKSGIAKIKQSLIAKFVVDKLISKDDQITLFINMMYFGRVDNKPIIGLESAAKTYYKQSLRTLDEDRYISLIAMIVMPGTFHIIDHPEWNRDRVNRIRELVAGNYKPKSLMDQYYGELPEEVIKAGLPAFSYFGDAS